MKRYLNQTFSLLMLLASMQSFSQNQFHLTQYMAHQPFINPASMGKYDNLNGAVFYKNQWVGFDGAPTLIGFNVNLPIFDEHNRIGLSVVNDQIGVNNNTEISAGYGYTIKLNTNSNLTFGLAASLKLIQSDFASVNTTVVDPEFQSNSPTFALPNFKFGAYYRVKNFYAGLALPNLLKNYIGYNSGEYFGGTGIDFSDWHLYLHTGYSWEINKNLDLNSSAIFKHVSGSPFQVDVSTVLAIQKKFGFGINYRTSKELSGLLRFRLNPMLEFAYAYDFSLGQISNYSSGSHELMLIFDVYNKDKKPSTAQPRY